MQHRFQLVPWGILASFSAHVLGHWGKRDPQWQVSPCPGGRAAGSTLRVCHLIWTPAFGRQGRPCHCTLPPTTDRGKWKGRSVVRPMGTAAYRGKGQGKGKGRGEGRLGQGGRGRSKGGEKPMGTTAYGGKGSKGRAGNGDRPVGAASCRRDHHTLASCQNPHLLWVAHSHSPARSSGWSSSSGDKSCMVRVWW